MKKLIFFSLLLIVLAYWFYPEKVITFPPGVTASEEPVQTNIPPGKTWSSGDYKIEALAGYNIKARVLSRNNFHMDKVHDLSPFDLALGWGPMSDQEIIDQVEISQSNRWYKWHAGNLPIPSQQIGLYSANVHIIPKDENVKDKFDDVYKGSLVEMKGYLVNVRGEKGMRWISSLRRDDTGGGACEIFWVEDVNVINSSEETGE